MQSVNPYQWRWPHYTERPACGQPLCQFVRLSENAMPV
ncbi:hypothetical protein PFWH6_1771 [Pseudomonas fluorescens WH6]|nr:hypothetical protein PFWH6_1771 [Pseudomonas fluorescens WH6]